MKLNELIHSPLQIKKPQSPGSRGLRLNQKQPARRYFDYTVNKTKKPKSK